MCVCVCVCARARTCMRLECSLRTRFCGVFLNYFILYFFNFFLLKIAGSALITILISVCAFKHERIYIYIFVCTPVFLFI